MSIKKIVIYIRSDAGTLTRHEISGMTREEHQDHYKTISDDHEYPRTEVLTGWPESLVEWTCPFCGYGLD